MEIFGSNVFNDTVMRARLPKATYKALKKRLPKVPLSKPVLLKPLPAP